MKIKDCRKYGLSWWLWLTPEDFVPRNRNVRIILFIVLNIISIASFLITALCINFPYGYACWMFLFGIFFFFYRRAFFVHAQRYPLNCYDEYKFDVKKDKLLVKNGKLVFELRKVNKGYYVIKMAEKKLYFNMKGCLFPISLIRCYLIRQYLMFCINKKN